MAMQIGPLTAPGLEGSGNTSYNSAKAAADSVKFSKILEEVQGRAEKALNPKEAAAIQEAKARCPEKAARLLSIQGPQSPHS
jgi:flagellar protein FlgJ